MLKNILNSKIDFYYTKHHKTVFKNYYPKPFFRTARKNSRYLTYHPFFYI